MRKSLGNKRNQIGDGEDNRPDQIAEITKIYGNFTHDEKRKIEVDDVKKSVIVSKIFDNKDFGFNKITVERPLRLNLKADAERIARLDEIKAFQKMASSDKKNEKIRQQEIEEGIKRQQAIKELLAEMAKKTKGQLFKDRAEFIKELKDLDQKIGVRLSATESKIVLEALSEKDETAEICRDAKGNPEPDADLRDTENVPLKENIDEYFRREVLLHVPDAWVDHSKTKIGYEIPLNRHFYRYEPPRPLEAIETDIKGLETEIVTLLAEVTGSNGEKNDQ
jgi:type I restriction enzyme M protein